MIVRRNGSPENQQSLHSSWCNDGGHYPLWYRGTRTMMPGTVGTSRACRGRWRLVGRAGMVTPVSSSVCGGIGENGGGTEPWRALHGLHELGDLHHGLHEVGGSSAPDWPTRPPRPPSPVYRRPASAMRSRRHGASRGSRPHHGEGGDWRRAPACTTWACRGRRWLVGPVGTETPVEPDVRRGLRARMEATSTGSTSCSASPRGSLRSLGLHRDPPLRRGR
jgi:hypothetical protein